MKKMILPVLLLAACLLCACGAKKEAKAEPVSDAVVEIVVKDYGTITVELDGEAAPITVANFKKLVSENFYDGIIFHRVINGFMIQGGDPEGTGMGGSPDRIKGEFASNGVANPLSHTTGVVSMARRGNDNDSASSQFFIMHKTAPHLDGDYAAFGKVWRGIETVNQIAEVPTNSSDKPLTDVVIKTMSFVEIPQ